MAWYKNDISNRAEILFSGSSVQCTYLCTYSKTFYFIPGIWWAKMISQHSLGIIFFLYYIEKKLIYPPVQSLKFMYYSSMIFRCVASLRTNHPFYHLLTNWLTRCFFHWLTLKMLWHPDHMECYASIGPSDLGTIFLLFFVYVYFVTGK